MIELDVLSAAQQAADEDAQAAQGRPRPWRSAAHRDGVAAPSAEFMDPPSAADGHASRRTFLKVMGASTALAGRPVGVTRLDA